MEKILYLVRGLPGSGKSTFAKSLKNTIHFEADMYFMNDGKYEFDINEIEDAHKWCLGETRIWMANHGINIVVSNTFTEDWEMKPYYDLAKIYGYTVFSIIVENRHNGINEHNVPESTLTKMKNRFEIVL